jgi:integrase
MTKSGKRPGGYTSPGWLPDWLRIYPDGRLTYWDEFAKGAGVRRNRRCGDTAAAETLARDLMKQAARSAGLAVAAGSTWSDLCQAWVDAHDGKLKEGTFRRRLTAINVWIVPAVGSVDVAATDLSTLLAVADQLAASGTGRSNFDGVVQSMQVVAEWGRARRWLPPDPLGADSDRRAQLKRLRAQLKNAAAHAANDGNEKGVTLDQVPTWEQVCELADAVADRVAGIARSAEVGAQFGRAIRISAGTGVRLTELLGLTPADIDLTRGTVSVTRQLDRYTRWEADAPMPTAPPKHGHNRTALAWAIVKDDLEEAVAFVGDADAPLFAPYRDQRWFADAWGRVLEATRDDIGWHWPPHYLRHHYGSYSLAPREAGGLGMPAVEVQHSMGHADLSTTLDTYIQPTREQRGWVS